MVSFRLLIAFIFTLILALACSVDAQTLHYFTGDTVPCYAASCGCDKTYQETISPPWDGCIGFDQASPGPNRALILVVGNGVVKDTCIATRGDGIPTEVCFSSLDTVKIYFCGPDSTAVGVWHFPGTGNAPLGPQFATLCAPVSIAHPITSQAQQSGYTDLLGRFWTSQPLGVSYSWADRKKVLRFR